MLQNLHTHTDFCDGKCSSDEVIASAVTRGFDSVGFSSHAPTSLRTDWEMRDIEGYVKKIKALKKAYEGKIKIYLGVELDYFSKGLFESYDFDYKIGSVHGAEKDGVPIDFDNSVFVTRSAIDEHFCKNAIDFARLYYDTVIKMSNEIDYDIVGHFDVVTKFSDLHPDLIDTESKEYRNAALQALHTVREKHELFEVNTGAMARGYKKLPYPAPFLLKEMRALDCKLVLTSDSHDAARLDYGFDEAKDYIRAHGFDTLYYLTDNGFSGEKI